MEHLWNNPGYVGLVGVGVVVREFGAGGGIGLVGVELELE